MNDIYKEIKYFTCKEMDSPDEEGSGQRMNLEFLKILDQIREKAGFPLKVTSGYRTEKQNMLVGGKGESAHKKGVAVDFQVSNARERFDLIRAAIECGITRIGVSMGTLVHLDMDFEKDQRVMWGY